MEYITFGEGTLDSIRGRDAGTSVQSRTCVPGRVQQRVRRKSGLSRSRQPPPPRRMDHGGWVACTAGQ
nr:unnamed protein product [Callosobruchus analis]